MWTWQWDFGLPPLFQTLFIPPLFRWPLAKLDSWTRRFWQASAGCWLGCQQWQPGMIYHNALCLSYCMQWDAYDWLLIAVAVAQGTGSGLQAWCSGWGLGMFDLVDLKASLHFQRHISESTRLVATGAAIGCISRSSLASFGGCSSNLRTLVPGQSRASMPNRPGNLWSTTCPNSKGCQLDIFAPWLLFAPLTAIDKWIMVAKYLRNPWAFSFSLWSQDLINAYKRFSQEVPIWVRNRR